MALACRMQRTQAQHGPPKKSAPDSPYDSCSIRRAQAGRPREKRARICASRNPSYSPALVHKTCCNFLTKSPHCADKRTVADLAFLQAAPIVCKNQRTTLSAQHVCSDKVARQQLALTRRADCALTESCTAQVHMHNARAHVYYVDRAWVPPLVCAESAGRHYSQPYPCQTTHKHTCARTRLHSPVAQLLCAAGWPRIRH